MLPNKCGWCGDWITKDNCYPVMNGWQQIGVACSGTCQGELEILERDRQELDYECGLGPYWEDFQ